MIDVLGLFHLIHSLHFSVSIRHLFLKAVRHLLVHFKFLEGLFPQNALFLIFQSIQNVLLNKLFLGLFQYMLYMRLVETCFLDSGDMLLAFNCINVQIFSLLFYFVIVILNVEILHLEHVFLLLDFLSLLFLLESVLICQNYGIPDTHFRLL